MSIAHEPGEQVGAGAPLVVLEAMKMEHEVLSATPACVSSVEVSVGEAVEEGQLLVLLGAGAARTSAGAAAAPAPAARRRRARRPARRCASATRVGLDAARPEAVARRRERGRRTARENLADLVDEGTLRRVRPAAVRRPGARGARARS